MTQQRHRHKRRTFLAPDPLWSAFTAKYGERGKGRRLRELMAMDLEREMPPAEDRGHQERNSIEQTEAG